MKGLSDSFDPTADPADDDIDPDELHESHTPEPSLSDYARNGEVRGYPFRP